MQLEGWKCLECGVVYAPFIKECRCSVKIQDNVDIAGCPHSYTDGRCTQCGLMMPGLVCFHNWPSTSAPCTKCGVMMGAGITFTPTVVPTVDISGCEHVYPDSSLTTAGRFCSLCGAQEVLWERPGTICKVTVSAIGGDTDG